MTRHGLCLASLAVLAGCSGHSRSSNEPLVLRLGYFPNVTHAPAIVAVEEGFITQELGPGVSLETHTFNAGPEVVEAIFDIIRDSLRLGDKVKISGFGTFVVNQKHARRGRNPQTGDSITIDSRRVLSFKPSQVLKDRVNNGTGGKA